jgi:hypothetical protein
VKAQFLVHLCFNSVLKMDKTISDVADMLKEASEKLRKAAQDQSAQPNRGNSDSCESTGTSTTTRSRDRQVGTSQTDE